MFASCRPHWMPDTHDQSESDAQSGTEQERRRFVPRGKRGWPGACRGERAGGGAETQAGEPWGAGDGRSKLSGAGAVTDFGGRSPSRGPSLRHLVRSPGREMGRECCRLGQEPTRWPVSAGALGAPPRDGLGPPGGPAQPGRSPGAQPAVLRQPFRSWARGPHPLAAGAANPQRKSNISPGTAQPYISPPGPPRYSRRGRWTRTEPGPQPRDHQPRGSQARRPPGEEGGAPAPGPAPRNPGKRPQPAVPPHGHGHVPSARQTLPGPPAPSIQGPAPGHGHQPGEPELGDRPGQPCVSARSSGGPSLPPSVHPAPPPPPFGPSCGPSSAPGMQHV